MKIKWNARAFPAKQKPVMHSGFALENNLYVLKNGKSFKLQPVFYRNFIHRIKPLPNTQKLPDGTRDGNNMQCALSKPERYTSLIKAARAALACPFITQSHDSPARQTLCSAIIFSTNKTSNFLKYIFIYWFIINEIYSYESSGEKFARKGPRTSYCAFFCRGYKIPKKLQLILFVFKVLLHQKV